MHVTEVTRILTIHFIMVPQDPKKMGSTFTDEHMIDRRTDGHIHTKTSRI